MPAAPRYPGLCAYCGAEVSKASAAPHLAKCTAHAAALKRKGRHRSRFDVDLYHIRAQATHFPEFWLDLELPGHTLLEDIDDYLRAIWLECCGHMSAFSLGGWGTPKLAMDGFVGDVFRHRARIMHVYDFGTESWTTLQRIGVRHGQPAIDKPISLLVRNKLPDVRCIECGAAARWLCIECVIEDDRMGFLCAKDAKTHDHTEYGRPLKVVNSPRLGLCGYTGPARPPY